MRVRKAVRSKTAASQPAAPKTAPKAAKPRPTQPEWFDPSSFGPGAIVLAVIALVVIAVLIAGRDDSSDPTAAYAQPSIAEDAPAEPAAPPAEPKKSAAKAAKPAPAKPAAANVAAKTPAPPAPAPAATASSTATIAGCLERADGGFRLKDTSGEDAPRARSWKTGFLKKGSAPIAVVDTANALGLGSHVGQRVSVTGTLIDREMRAHSLRRVAASCN